MSNLPPPPPRALPPPSGPPAAAWPAPHPIHRAPEAIGRPGRVPDSALGGRPTAPTRRRTLALVALVVVLLAGGLASAYNRRQGPGWAARWDPRVEPLARFVEQHRGLTFTHPVRVEFVPEQQFLDEMRRTDTPATPQPAGDATKDDPELPLWQATGLVSASFTQQQSSSDAASGVLGAYDPATHAIRVRGDQLTASVKVTLVHELTHAVQDQHFALGTLQMRPETNSADAAMLGLIEGDAVSVENEYVAQLSDADRAALDDREGTVADAPELDRVPGALLASIQMPYALGPSFVDTVDNLGGRGARDRLFAEPPEADVELMFPDLYLRGFTPVEVEPPTLVAGETALDNGGFSDDVGAFSWALILASRLDVHRVAEVVEHWGGDRYAVFRRGLSVCARLVVAGADGAGTTGFFGALTEWAAAGPAGAATVLRTGSSVTMTACDDGLPAPAPSERFDAVLGLLAVRSDVVAPGPDPQDSSTDLAARACLGDAVVKELTNDELQDLGALSDGRVGEVRAAAAATCGVSF